MQVEEHPSNEIWFLSSHSSFSSSLPFPHKFSMSESSSTLMHFETGIYESHIKPVSTLQEEEQPSPSKISSSLQDSYETRIPSPHIPEHSEGSPEQVHPVSF